MITNQQSSADKEKQAEAEAKKMAEAMRVLKRSKSDLRNIERRG